jgi:hypothetical protein
LKRFIVHLLHQLANEGLEQVPRIHHFALQINTPISDPFWKTLKFIPEAIKLQFLQL